VIFVTVLGVIVILSGLLLAFAQDMRTEALAAANRESALQADAVELAAEQYVMAQIDLNDGIPPANASVINGSQNTTGKPDSWTICYNTPAEAVQVGNGIFWLIKPNEQSSQVQTYGIIDECSKLNLNAASFNSTQWALFAPNMTSDVADAVQDWKNTAAKASSDGAESDYYNALDEPYDAKNQPFETVEEMLLVRGITPEELYGYDTNRDGILDQNELAASNNGNGELGVTIDDPRGLARYLTVYSKGEAAIQPAQTVTAARGGGRATVTTAAPTPGMINVNTAPEYVLLSIPAQGSNAQSPTAMLTQQQADALINAAQSTQYGLALASDVTNALGTNAPPGFLAATTTTSYQYSADIVAVSGDGRAFKRVRIVVDCSPAKGATTATQPCRIVYRRDLTGLGWPLPPEVRTQLRSGAGINSGVGGSNIQETQRP
jgi:type II secretory pathway component PulK